MEIGEKIRKLRTDAGMTQDDLASRLGVTRTAVSKWETGKGWPGVDSLKLIADEFGVTIDALVSDEDVEQKRAVEHRRGLRYYWAAIACALAAMALALVSHQGLLPKGLAFAGTWGTCGGFIGYVIFGFLFSRSSERIGIKRTIVGRIVVILVVLVAMVGYVATMGATP
ncbi:MAG: helix-turn-helix transcriptional regulator [Olsenella sp.]|jgi:transcriptional regulator with XRE-family HTH domain